jgi:predicted transcriptional regulator
VAGTTPRPADAADAGRAVAGALALLVLVALYQRLTRPAALDQPLRARVHAACVVRGGWATAREIGEAVGVGRTTAEYHLVYLARLGLLQAARVTPRRRVFAPRAAAAAASEAGEPLPDQVLGLVRARAEVPLSAIARELRLTRTRADRCVKDLLLEGRLASRWEDGARLYSLPQRG